MKRETKHGVNMAGKGERGVQPPATARCTVTFTIFVTPAPCTAWIRPSSTSALLAAPALVPVKAWGQTWQFGSLRMALGWQGTGRRLEGACSCDKTQGTWGSSLSLAPPRRPLLTCCLC